ncbi:DnaB-like helicase C-terminal domain-containing protein [Actinopolymorpha pittospori]|uniref:Replicative DNA helicase n=1 Tax=Actinopolymorpha pittospori TaxID=648752 RepID=A0A927MV43_9ACTN|nr:replicative DNA helicase [Actinopolymorpha pittospori]
MPTSALTDTEREVLVRAAILAPSMQQDADVVILLRRDDYYNAEDRHGEADLIVAKNRSGPAWTVAVAAALHRSTFRTMASTA